MDRSAACGCVWGGSVAGWMLLVLLINEVDEVYVGKAEQKSERCCICIFVSFRVDIFSGSKLGWARVMVMRQKKRVLF